MRPKGQELTRRVLVIRPDNIGNVVLAGPALHTPPDPLPAARLTLLCSPAGSQVVPLLPWVHDAIGLRAVWQDVGERLQLDPQRELGLASKRRARVLDAALIRRERPAGSASGTTCRRSTPPRMWSPTCA